MTLKILPGALVTLLLCYVTPIALMPVAATLGLIIGILILGLL